MIPVALGAFFFLSFSLIAFFSLRVAVAVALVSGSIHMWVTDDQRRHLNQLFLAARQVVPMIRPVYWPALARNARHLAPFAFQLVGPAATFSPLQIDRLCESIDHVAPHTSFFIDHLEKPQFKRNLDAFLASAPALTRPEVLPHLVKHLDWLVDELLPEVERTLESSPSTDITVLFGSVPRLAIHLDTFRRHWPVLKPRLPLLISNWPLVEKHIDVLAGKIDQLSPFLDDLDDPLILKSLLKQLPVLEPHLDRLISLLPSMKNYLPELVKNGRLEQLTSKPANLSIILEDAELLLEVMPLLVPDHIDALLPYADILCPVADRLIPHAEILIQYMEYWTPFLPELMKKRRIEQIAENIDVLAPGLPFLAPHISSLVPFIDDLLPYSDVLMENFGWLLKYSHRSIPLVISMLPKVGKALDSDEKRERRRLLKEREVQRRAKLAELQAQQQQRDEQQLWHKTPNTGSRSSLKIGGYRAVEPTGISLDQDEHSIVDKVVAAASQDGAKKQRRGWLRGTPSSSKITHVCTEEN